MGQPEIYRIAEAITEIDEKLITSACQNSHKSETNRIGQSFTKIAVSVAALFLLLILLGGDGILQNAVTDFPKTSQIKANRGQISRIVRANELVHDYLERDSILKGTFADNFLGTSFREGELCIQLKQLEEKTELALFLADYSDVIKFEVAYENQTDLEKDNGPDQENSDQYQYREAEVVFSVPVSETGNGLALDFSQRQYSMGPEDFCILPNGDFLILNSADRSISRYQGAELAERFFLESEQHPIFLLSHENSVYVSGYEKLIRLDLTTGEQTAFEFPVWEDGTLGSLVDDMIWEDGNLILISELKGNYALDESAGEIISVSAGWDCLRSGTTVSYRKRDSRWLIPAPNTSLQMVDMSERGEITLLAYDFKKGPDSIEWCTVRRYDEESGLVGTSSVACTNWVHRPWNFVYEGDDGAVYVMAVYSTEVKIYLVELGKTVVFDGDNPDPK